MKISPTYLLVAMFMMLNVAAYAQAKKLSLMVVPSDIYCNKNGFMAAIDDQGQKIKVPDYQRLFLEDRNMRAIISGVNNFMNDRGFSLIDMEAALKNLDIEAAEESVMYDESGEELTESLLDKIKRRAKADIIIDVDFAFTQTGPIKTITFNLKGIDAYTTRQIAGVEGVGKPSATPNIEIMLIEDNYTRMTDFSAALSNYFEKPFKEGREVSIVIRLSKGASVGFDTEYGGQKFSEILDNWFNKNTFREADNQNGRYSIRDMSDVRMLVIAKIPVFDAKGIAIDAGEFAQQLRKFLKTAPYNLDAAVSARGLGQAHVIIGDRTVGDNANVLTSNISFEKLKEACKDIPRGERLRITVTRFSVSSRAAQATGQFGEELTAIMTNAIQQFNCFRVLESTKNKGDLDGEIGYNQSGRTDGSGPQWGQQPGAQAIVTAEIIEYSDGTSGISVAGVSVGTSKAKIGIIVKVIDPQSRELLWSKSVNAEAKKGGFTGASVLGFKFTGASKVSEAMSAAVEDMVLRTVDVLVKEKEVILKEFAAKEAAPKISKTTIVINNTNFLNINKLSTELKGHGKVEEIREKTISGANGSFVVLHHGSTDDLAEIIFDKSGAKYNIVSMSPGVIELMAEEARGTSQAEQNNLLHEKAGSYWKMGDYARALTTYQELIEAAKSSSEEQLPEYSRSMSNLAGLYMEMGAFDQSLALFQEVVSSAESSREVNTPEYVTTLNNLAVLYSETGDDAKALGVLEKAVIISRKNNNYQSHIGILTNMAQLHLKMGNCPQALALYSEMAIWTKKALGREHPDFARSLANVAAMYEDMGRYAEALLIHREVLEITGKTLGPHTPYLEQRKNAMRVNYRLLKQLQNKFEQFRPLCEALEKKQEYKNILKEDFAGIFGRMTCHEKPGPTVNDLTLLLSALASETGDSIKISAVLSLAETYKAAGGYGKADSLYAYVLEHVNRNGDKYIEIHLNMGEMRRQRGVFEQAALHYDTVLAVLNKRIVPSDALYLRAYSEYAALQRAQNNLEKADSLYAKAQEFGSRVKYLPEYPVMLTEAAALKMRMGQTEEAFALLESCMALTRRQERGPSIGRKNYALFFCTDEYENSVEWPPLKNPIGDGEALAAVLHDKFDFDTIVFRNPKVSTIIDEIEKTLKREYRSNDQLFLFFAGHGYFNNDSKMGGIVARNTQRNDKCHALRVRNAARPPGRQPSLPAHFLAIDVCFGGTFFKEVAQEKSSGRGYGSVGGNYESIQKSVSQKK